MGKTIKRKWLKALKGESPHGVYLKTTGVLHEEDGKGRDCFCALGVLLNETVGFTGKEGHNLPSSYRHEIGMRPYEEENVMDASDEHDGWDEVIKYIEENL